MGLFKSREKKARDIEHQKAEEELEIEEKKKAEKEREEFKKYAESRILTISASDYVAKEGKNLTDYDFKFIFATRGHFEERSKSAIVRIMEKGIEIGAEVIVDVRVSQKQRSPYVSDLCLIGTALIPKK